MSDDSLFGNPWSDMTAAMILGSIVEDTIIQGAVYQGAYAYHYPSYLTKEMAKATTKKAGTTAAQKSAHRMVAKSAGSQVSKQVAKVALKKASQEAAKSAAKRAAASAAAKAASLSTPVGWALAMFSAAMIVLDFIDIFGGGKGYSIILDKAGLEEIRTSFQDALEEYGVPLDSRIDFDPEEVFIGLTREGRYDIVPEYREMYEKYTTEYMKSLGYPDEWWKDIEEADTPIEPDSQLLEEYFRYAPTPEKAENFLKYFVYFAIAIVTILILMYFIL